MDMKIFRRVIDINQWGVVYGSRVFMRELKSRPEASLVNISSINGMVPFPKQAPYNMSRYAVLGLNETLMMDLRDTAVQVLSVHPGGIRTNIANYSLNPSAENPRFFGKVVKTTSEQAAVQIIKGIKKKKPRIFIGADAKFLQFVKRINARAALAISRYLVVVLGERLKQK